MIFSKLPESVLFLKNCDASEFTNYRQISILPSFLFFFEKLVYNRLQNNLLKNNILTNNQFGFRCKHDTSMTVIEIVDTISTAGDNSEYYAWGIHGYIESI